MEGVSSDKTTLLTYVCLFFKKRDEECLLSFSNDTIKPVHASDLPEAPGNLATKNIGGDCHRTAAMPFLSVLAEIFHLNKQSQETAETITQNITVLKTLSTCSECEVDLNNALCVCVCV